MNSSLPIDKCIFCHRNLTQDYSVLNCDYCYGRYYLITLNSFNKEITFLSFKINKDIIARFLFEINKLQLTRALILGRENPLIFESAIFQEIDWSQPDKLVNRLNNLLCFS